MTQLQYWTHVSPPTPMALPGSPYGPALTSPLTTTLIFGAREAVLVDPPITIEQTEAVADWIASFERELTTIVITHGHADHWFGTSLLLQRFPDATAVATADTVAMMHVQGSPEFKAQMYDPMLPGQIPADTSVLTSVLDSAVLDLEGKEVCVVDVGHSDTDGTSVIHVPSIGLVVGGDVVYNQVHHYLVESATDDAIQAWLSAIDHVESLGADLVVAGHKNECADDNAARVINLSREYLRAVQRNRADSGSAQEFVDRMIDAFPTWLNKSILLMSAQTLFANGSPSG